MVRILFLAWVSLLMLIAPTAFASSVTNFFYFADDKDATVPYRLKTATIALPDNSAPGDPLGDFPKLQQTGNGDLIMLMNFVLFCGTDDSTCETEGNYKRIRKNPDQQVMLALDRIAAAGKASQVVGWYIFDEPYVDAPSKRIPKIELEIATNILRWRSQAVPYQYSSTLPRFVNFARDCFKCSGSRDSACMPISQSGSNYCGSPGNADWVGFNWYATDTQNGNANCNSTPINSATNTANCHIDTHVNTYVSPTLTDLKNHKWSYQDIIMFPGTWTNGSNNITAVGTNEALARYLDLVSGETDVVGLVPFTYRTSPSTHLGLVYMDHADEAEAFYQALAVDSIPSLQDTSWVPVFEYSDDTEYMKTGAISPADSHFYTLGYQGVSQTLYNIRRFAFYTRSTATAEYTRQIFRCRVNRANGRITVFFSLYSHCDGVSVAIQDGTGYVSPVQTAEADHLIINCRSNAAPYWDSAWTIAGPSENPTTVCQESFGSGYFYFNNVGYSKKF